MDSFLTHLGLCFRAAKLTGFKIDIKSVSAAESEPETEDVAESEVEPEAEAMAETEE